MIASFILPGGAFSSGAGFAVYAQTYSDGDTFEYGYYPKSLVTDEDTLAALSALSVTPVSFGFYSGSGSRYDGTMAASDYMTYADAVYDGGRYRLVRFESYRPYVTGLSAGTDGASSYQDDNGYEISTDYWFKYEPVTWKVINASEGLVISESVIDSQAFNDFAYFDSYASDAKYAYYGVSNKAYFCCDYAESSIRAWLADDFAAAAFTANELANAAETELDNSGYLTLNGTSGYTRLDAAATQDKIFLLSSAEVADGVNGFDGIESRLAYPTDYAKCMGVYAYKYTGSGSEGSTYGVYDGVSPWLLRTAGTTSDYVCCVTNGGSVKQETYIASAAYCGIRPAMRLNNLNLFKVTYNANSGEGAPESDTGYGEITLSSIEPVKEGYTFKGWSESETATSASYQSSGAYNLVSDIILYAVWEETVVPAEYTLTYNANGGTNVPASQTGNGEITLSSSVPSKEGYTFKGWSESETAINASYQPSGTYNLVSDTTLYAVWEEIVAPVEYTLTYNANGGTNAPARQTGSGAITLSSSIPVRDGYTFKGWALSTGAVTAAYQPSDSFNLNADTVLYAVWSKNASINIRGYRNSRSEDYKATITFHAVTSGDTDGCTVQWYLNGSPAGTGESFTVSQATAGYTVQVKLIKNGTAVSESGVETVSINTGFFAKIIAFFRGLFGKLPVIDQ